MKARLAAELRTRELDSKRRKLKEDLEARERNAGASLVTDKTASQNLQVSMIFYAYWDALFLFSKKTFSSYISN